MEVLIRFKDKGPGKVTMEVKPNFRELRKMLQVGDSEAVVYAIQALMAVKKLTDGAENHRTTPGGIYLPD